MSWNDFTGITYDRRGLIARLNQVKWGGMFRPVGIVLHNTAAPTLAQWAETGPSHEARIKNLRSYYQGLGWHAGPHWFVSRENFTEFMDPSTRGTHSPSFNADHFGIEMVGNYDKEEFSSGDGAKVRDNAVFLMAYLCNHFGWNPERAIKLHKEDPKTTHACPGSKVSKRDIIDRVRVQMANLGVTQDDRHPVDEGDVKVFKDIIATTFGGGSDNQASAYGGMIDGDIRLGASLPARFAGKPPNIIVRSRDTEKEVCVPIRDVGPWLIDDPYWETGERPVAEANVIIPRGKHKGKNSNGAGIDLTPATVHALGLNLARGKWRVDWWFDPGQMQKPPEDDTPLTDKGDRNAYVAYAQKLLGFSERECDGVFGKMTETAVIWFQRRKGLTVDGKIGDETWAALQDDYEGE